MIIKQKLSNCRRCDFHEVKQVSIEFLQIGLVGVGGQVIHVGAHEGDRLGVPHQNLQPDGHQSLNG